MKAYKEYMDRIRVDEEQHGKLLEAVRAAEAEQTKNAAPEPAKTRRFPLKAFGLIASAAAVIVLIVGVFPDRQATKTDSMNTAEPMASEAIAANSPLEEAEVTARTEAELPNEGPNSSSFTSSFPVNEYAASECAAYTYNGVIDLRGAAADGKQNQPGTAAFQTAPQTADESRKAAARKGLVSLIETMIPQMQKAGEEDSANDRENICRFLIDGEEYLYRAAEGILSAEGREYVLTASERAEMRKLLNDYFGDK